MTKSSVSRTYFQILCFALEKWAGTQTSNTVGGQVDVVQEFITIQSFGHKMGWWANGIRVEYFPGFTTLQLCQQSPRVPCQKWTKSQNNLQDGSSSCRCSTTSHGDLQTMNRNANLKLNLVSIYTKKFGTGQWSFLGPGSEKKWSPISEDSPQGEWDKIVDLMVLKFGDSTQSFDLRVHCPEECLKTEVVENCRYTIAPTHNCFCQSAQYLRSNCRYVWRNVPPAIREQGDLLFKDNRTHCSCQLWWRHTYIWPMTLHNQKKIYCKDFRNELKIITIRESEQILRWCRIPDHNWRRTVFHDERHWIILTIHRCSALSWAHSFIWTKRLDSREHCWTRIGSYNLSTSK